MSTKTKRYRWACPICNKGALGPSRPRKDNAVRYCLPCTAKTGKLVARTCPALDSKRDRKTQAKKEVNERKRATAPRKPRKTSRAFIRLPRHNVRGTNMMLAAERMCKSKQWTAAVNKAFRSRGLRPTTTSTVASKLWQRTVDQRGGSVGSGVIYFSNRGRRGVGGKGGPGFGAVVYGCKDHHTRANVLETLLHEIVHVVHLAHMRAPKINGVRRPHAMDFNLILCHMAGVFWGYPCHPYEAGYSTGNGYAPSRHLEAWLGEQIRDKNPRVMRWLEGLKHPAVDEPANDAASPYGDQYDADGNTNLFPTA